MKHPSIASLVLFFPLAFSKRAYYYNRRPMKKIDSNLLAIIAPFSIGMTVVFSHLKFLGVSFSIIATVNRLIQMSFFVSSASMRMSHT